MFASEFRAVFVASICVCVAAFNANAQTFNSIWEASSGSFPDQSCDWTLTDTAAPEDPSLGGGVLTISTSPFIESMFYIESGSQLNITYPVIIEARVKLISESHTAGNPRLGTAFSIAVAANQQNILFIGQDEVFLWASFGVQGPTANVDTDDAFHTYRMEVSAGGVIDVYQDGGLILTGAIIFDNALLDEPTIYWGDGTGAGEATSEWAFFKHTANSEPCGTVPVEEGTWGAVKNLYK